jgi:Got1/Sft2-like family
LISSGKNFITSTTGKFTFALEEQTKNQSVLHEKNYYAALGCLIAGALFLFLSLTFLPLVFIAPNKFNLFFSLGSTFIQAALAFYHGPIPYVKLLFKRENLVISLFYATSLLLAIYSSIIWGTYLSAILVVALQIFALVWFVKQTFIGGQDASQQFQTFLVGNVFKSMVVNKFFQR